jgi:hypothetical protein
MKINKISLLVCIITPLSIYAQKTSDYKFLIEGQYNTRIYEKFERREGTKIYMWNKIEETFENSPGIAFTEYYIQINCDTKTSILKSSITHWRDKTVQKLDDLSNKEISITDPKSVPGLLYKNYCRK